MNMSIDEAAEILPVHTVRGQLLRWHLGLASEVLIGIEKGYFRLTYIYQRLPF